MNTLIIPHFSGLSSKIIVFFVLTFTLRGCGMLLEITRSVPKLGGIFRGVCGAHQVDRRISVIVRGGFKKHPAPLAQTALSNVKIL